MDECWMSKSLVIDIYYSWSTLSFMLEDHLDVLLELCLKDIQQLATNN